MRSRLNNLSFDPLTLDKKAIGIVMIMIGATMLIWTGFPYTKKEKVIDAEPMQVSADREKSVNWPRYTDGILVLGGWFWWH